ncbi:MAG: hypothetical protein FLDDKLPJ_03339 [Phycisphaerae bacterium]|nr:hypothetical protein [Phycisphaerae bacterium]
MHENIQAEVLPWVRQLPGSSWLTARYWAVLVVDRSPSMLEQDWQPSRLAAAIEGAIGFVMSASRENRANQVAVVAFDQFAQLVSHFVPAVDAGLASRIRAISSGSNTSITAGLMAAETLFQTATEDGASRMVLLLTDGVHNSGPEPYDVATRLKRMGVRIQTVGIASEQAVNATMLKALASHRSDGLPDYRFIGDQQRLVEHCVLAARGLTL